MKVINNISKRGIYKYLDIADNENLSGAGDLYIVRDLRTKARKEPGATVANKNLNFVKISDAKIENFNKELYENRNIFEFEKDYKQYKFIGFDQENEKNLINFVFFEPTKKLKISTVDNSLGGYWKNTTVEIDTKNAINIQLSPYSNSNKPALPRIEADAKKTKEYNYYYLGNNNSKHYYCWITTNYYNQLRQKAFDKFYNYYLTREERYYSNYQKKLLKSFYENPKKFDCYIISAYSEPKKISDEERDSFTGLLTNTKTMSNLGKPTIKFEFENNEELKDFLKENKENLIDSSVEDAEVVEDEPNYKRKSLKGISEKSDIFNCPVSCLVTQGMKPTYKKLSDYSHLIDSAKNETNLRGYGFEDATLKLLADACKSYRQVEKLAAYLKADSEIQSAFNVWYWLHDNIKYNYDSPGSEEIRLPARTWQDRERGVDCDCLAVLTACLLYNMGYKPKFEIVGFTGSDKYSHIFVNLNGIAVDRVLPIFNRRPPLITKTMIMKIPVFELSGVDGMNKIQDEIKQIAGLQGIYNNILAKMFTHTATPADLAEKRKVQVLLQLYNTDKKAYKLGCIIMPYVSYIDDKGAYYFENPNVAKLAQKYDRELYTLDKKGYFDGADGEEKLAGLFSSVWNGIKSVGEAVWDTTKAAANAVANATKASVNIVKAGGQLITGNTKGAKETIKKAGSQIVSSVVDPTKQAWETTKDVTKKTVIEPTVATVRIAGKLFKVIFIRLNPLFLLMRSSLRLLLAINFLGMASRLNLANYSKDVVVANGYTESMYNDAKKAYDRVIRFFTKIGGDKSNIEKSIKNGAKKKAIFGKDYDVNTKIIETSDDDATLGGTTIIKPGLDSLGTGGTIASALASVGAFFYKIWGWVKNVVPKAVKWISDNKEKIQQGIDTTKTVLDTFNGGGSSNGTTSSGTTSSGTTSSGAIIQKQNNSNNNTLKFVAVAAIGVGLASLLLSDNKKKRK